MREGGIDLFPRAFTVPHIEKSGIIFRCESNPLSRPRRQREFGIKNLEAHQSCCWHIHARVYIKRLNGQVKALLSVRVRVVYEVRRLQADRNSLLLFIRLSAEVGPQSTYRVVFCCCHLPFPLIRPAPFPSRYALPLIPASPSQNGRPGQIRV